LASECPPQESKLSHGKKGDEMKRKTKLRIVAGIAIAALFVTGIYVAFHAGKYVGTIVEEAEVIIQGDLICNATVLSALRDFRENEPDRALRLLEGCLDGHVISFGFGEEWFPPDLWEVAHKRLVLIKQYRQKHPRDWSKEEEDMEHQLTIENHRAIQSAVKDILAKVELPEDGDK
jgi:hypothetical protein